MAEFAVDDSEPLDFERIIKTLEFIVAASEWAPLTDGDGNPVGVVPVDEGWIYVFTSGDCHHSYRRPDQYQESLNG